MPVPHPDVNRKIVPPPGKKLLKFLGLLVSEFVERRLPVEDFVVMGDFPQPVLGYRSPASHIPEKGHYVLFFLGSPVSNHHYGVKIILHGTSS